MRYKVLQKHGNAPGLYHDFKTLPSKEAANKWKDENLRSGTSKVVPSSKTTKTKFARLVKIKRR